VGVSALDQESDPAGYPPARHVVRDLAFDVEAVDPVRSRAHLPVTPELCRDGGIAAGPLMTTVDVLAGLLVGRVVLPDWMATAQLSLHLDRPPSSGTVVADAEVIRDGRTTIVVEVRLRGGGDPFGEAMLSFVRLPRRESNVDLSVVPVEYGRRTTLAVAGSGLVHDYDEELGIQVLDGPSGRLRLEVGEYVRNSFGAVNGGVVASLAAAAARAASSPLLAGPARVADAAVHYLGQGRVGPVETTARVVRRDASGVLTRVQVLDSGQSDDGRPRSMAVAHVYCTPPV
jgi:acyl-coenzyme A thioesterase PaaI-like protein